MTDDHETSGLGHVHGDSEYAPNSEEGQSSEDASPAELAAAEASEWMEAQGALPACPRCGSVGVATGDDSQRFECGSTIGPRLARSEGMVCSQRVIGAQMERERVQDAALAGGEPDATAAADAERFRAMAIALEDMRMLSARFTRRCDRCTGACQCMSKLDSEIRRIVDPILGPVSILRAGEDVALDADKAEAVAEAEQCATTTTEAEGHV
jgi:hypothetical protein